MSSVLGNYYETRPAIIEQSSILLCSSGSIILGLELTSGELLFSFKGHSDVVTSISYSDFQPTKVTSASKDGTLLTWDVQTRAVLSRHSVGSAVHAALSPQFTLNPHTGKADVYLVMKSGNSAAAAATVGDAYKFVIFDVENSKIRRNICEIIHPSTAVCLANVGGTEVVLAASKRKLCLVIAESRVGYKTMCPANHSITCVAANTHRDIIITGHSNGEILIWHDIRSWLAKETSKSSVQAELKSSELIAIPPPASTVMHWHAHAVTTISTNTDGSMLYSGGEEGVLVVWQTATGKKAFVPHLGAGMAHIVASNLFPLAVVTTNNNCLRVINTSSLLESWTISSLCVGPFLDHSFPSDRYSKSLLAVDPKTSLLACNGYPGQLQLYDVAQNSVRSIHEVVQFNRVSRTEKNTKIFVPSVSLFKFQAFHTARAAATRFLLATVDVRKGEEFAAESSLKFWCWSDAMNSYKLVTHVPRPHGLARVTCLAFCPASPHYTCATAAADGSVKLWRLDPASSAGRLTGDAHWNCVYSFTYRAVAVHGLCFSGDGSLLAVAHANTCSLWDPVGLVLRGSIVLPGPAHDITFAAFLEPSSGAGAYLVVGSKSCLAVYDLLTMGMTCRLDGQLSAFSVAASEAMALLAAPEAGAGAGAEAGTETKKTSKKQKQLTAEAGTQAPGLLEQGWIAVCRQGQRRGGASEQGGGAGPAWELLVLSPLPAAAPAGAGEAEEAVAVPAPRVVVSSPLAAEATGTVFWSKAEAGPMLNGSSSSNGISAGSSSAVEELRGACVLAATAAGELMLTSASIAADAGASSRICPQDGTALGWAEDAARRNESKAAALPAGVSFKSKGNGNKKSDKTLQATSSSGGQVKDGWLGEFFDGVSANVPPVASIYDDFMSSLMKKSASTLAPAPAPATAKGRGAPLPESAADGTDGDSDREFDTAEELAKKNAAKKSKANKDKKQKKMLEPQHIEAFSGSIFYY
jgi:WD40 repeat protein